MMKFLQRAAIPNLIPLGFERNRRDTSESHTTLSDGIPVLLSHSQSIV